MRQESARRSTAVTRPRRVLLDSGKSTTERFLDLVTRSGRRMHGKIVQNFENHAFAVRDDNGTVARWELESSPEGVMANYSLEGDFDPALEPVLRSEMRAKLARLVLDLERQAAGRT